MSPGNKIDKSIVDASYRPHMVFYPILFVPMSQYKLKQAELLNNPHTLLITGVVELIGSNLLENLLILKQKVVKT